VRAASPASHLVRLCRCALYLLQALGALLYVLCFGRLPFAGDSKLAIINARYDLPRPGTHNRPQQVRGGAGSGTRPPRAAWLV
jgi:hypothetical protein